MQHSLQHFFTQQGKTDIKTSIENILENTKEQYKNFFLSDMQQHQNIKNIIDKLKKFINL